MQFSHIIIRFAELNTKGKNKKDFINTLYSNIKFRLRHFEPIIYRKTHDRIYLDVSKILNSKIEEMSTIIKEIPGISSYSFVYQCQVEIDAIVTMVTKLVLQASGETFKIKTKRVDKSFPFRSDAINRLVAKQILSQSSWKVDVHDADIVLHIDIRPEGVFLFAHVEPGAGGLPLGVSGKALLLLSGGIDSPVAGYQMMRRGVKIEAIHFASPPYTSFHSLQKVIDIAKQLARFSGKIRLYVAHFTPMQEAIYALNEEAYAVTLMRRMMVRIAERVAMNKRCLALVSGESIGQVASQTLESMNVINATITIPMIRPLITWDKNQMIEQAQKIGTYSISIRPYEDCCTIFSPKNPATKPKILRAEILENRFDYASLIEMSMSTIQVIDVDENYQDSDETETFL